MSGSRPAEHREVAEAAAPPPAASRLPRKVLLFFLGFCAVPLLAVSVASSIMASRAVHQMLERESRREIAAWRRELRGLLVRVEADAATIAGEGMRPEMPFRRALDGEPVGDDAFTRPFAFLGQRVLFRSLVLVRADGTPLARLYAPGLALGPRRLLHMARVERRQLGAADTLGFAAVVRRRSPLALLRPGPGVPTLRVLAAMRASGDDTVRGALAADVPLADLLEQAARGGVGADSAGAIQRFALDNASSTFLFHDRLENTALPASVVEPELAARALAAPVRTGSYRTTTGERRFLVAEREPRLAVVLGTSAASQRLLAPFQRAGLLVGLASLVLVAISAALVVLFSRAFRTALRRLLAASAAFATGDFGHRVALAPGDDLAVLGAGLDRMAGDLERLTAERERAARFESVSRVAALVAHDLKGMAFNLSMLAENLEREPAGERTRGRTATAIAALARQMQRTLGRLPQAGRTPERVRQRLDLAALAREVLQELGVEATPSVTLDARLGETAWIAGDPDALRRALANLVWNAIEAMPQGGRLEVEVRSNAAGATLRVADSGCGMDPAFLRTQLFQPFATTKQHGLGLGLVGVRETVLAHDGCVEVESAPGHGTTFRLILPAAPAAGSARTGEGSA